MSLNSPKPIIAHPEVGWGDCIDTEYGAEWRRSTPNANGFLMHERIRVRPIWFTEYPFVEWWTPGWSMVIDSDFSMATARWLVKTIGEARRIEILEEAWAMCEARKR